MPHFLDPANARGSGVVMTMGKGGVGKTPLAVTDPMLRARRNHEAVHLRELASHVTRTVLEPWHADVLAATATPVQSRPANG